MPGLTTTTTGTLVQQKCKSIHTHVGVWNGLVLNRYAHATIKCKKPIGCAQTTYHNTGHLTEGGGIHKRMVGRDA